MKRVIPSLLCVTILIASSGCRSKPSTPSPHGVDVLIEGRGMFPAELAGRWKADRDGWEFVFSPDGHIVSAVLSLGRVEIKPGYRVTLPTRSGGEGLFEPGPWTVHYVPETHQLTLKIVMTHIRIDMAGTIVEGTTTDTFSGDISPNDGVWQVQWTAFSKYTIDAPGSPVKELSTDETYGETKALTFRRVPEK